VSPRDRESSQIRSRSHIIIVQAIIENTRLHMPAAYFLHPKSRTLLDSCKLIFLSLIKFIKNNNNIYNSK
jgi:hypothetical protein